MPTPLRGRDAELAALRAQLDRLSAGVGTCWLVEGGPGLGKSRLLDEAAEAGGRAGLRVGRAAAEPTDQAVQMVVLLEALFEGPHPVLDRAALGDAHASPEQRYWLLQDLQTLLEGAALRRPILVCLDDLQWADSGTIAALGTLPARLAPLPIGWVLAYRPGESQTDLTRALAELSRGGAGRAVLRALEPPAVARIAADVLGAEPDEALLALTQRVRGNPFLLTELLAGLREDGLVAVESGRARLLDARLPRRLRETMRSRLGRLSPGGQRLAAVAASMDRRFTVDDLARVLAVPASSLLDAVGELVRAELFVESDDALAFGHDLTREAVRASQPASAVQALDRQAAAAFLAAGALPLEVATQLAASAAPGDELAVQTLARAAETLGPTDPGQAADLARRALDLLRDVELAVRR